MVCSDPKRSNRSVHSLLIVYILLVIHIRLKQFVDLYSLVGV